MKYTLAIAATLVAGICSSAMAEGHVSQAQLADFGLAGMETMTDAEATEVRGQGFAFAGSISASAVPGAFDVSAASALGFNQATAVTASKSEFQVEGQVLVIGGPPLGGFFGAFKLSGSAGSAGFAYAAAN